MSEALNINPFGGGGNGGGSITIANNVEKDNYNAVSSDAVYRYVNNRLEAFGRYWIEENSTPVAAGYIGSADTRPALGYNGMGRRHRGIAQRC